MRFDNDLKAAELKNARLDTEIKSLEKQLKQLELDNRPRFWKGVLASPAFLAALIAVLATTGSAAVTWFVASQQQKADIVKNQAILNVERMKTEVGLLSGVVLAAKPGEACPISSQLAVYLRAQLFTDPAIREEVLKVREYYSDQCKNQGR